MTPNPDVLKRQEKLKENSHYLAAIDFVAKVDKFEESIIPDGHEPKDLVNAENPYIDSLMSFVGVLNSNSPYKDKEVTDVRFEKNGDFVLRFGDDVAEQKLVKGEEFYVALFWLNDKVEAEKAKVEAEKAAKAAPVAAVAVEQRTAVREKVDAEKDAKDETANQLGQLKTALGVEAKFVEFCNAANLSGKIFGETLLNDPKFLSTEHETLGLLVREALKDRDLSPIAEMLGAQGKDVKAVVELFYVGYFLDKLKAAYHPKFDRFKEYADQAGGAHIAYELTVKEAGEFTIEFKPKEVVQAYDEYVEKNKAPAAQTQEDADKIAKQEKIKKDAEALAQSPIGKLLGFLGYDKEGDDKKTGFERLASGQDFLGAFILGLFGYKEFVGDGYQGIVDMMPDKYQRMVEKWEKKAEQSKLHAKWQKKDGAAEGADGETVASYPTVKEDLFKKLLKGEALLPEGGFKLEESFPLPEDGILKVDLKAAEIIVPARSELGVIGKTRGFKDKDDLIEGGENIVVEIRGTLPKGLIFKGAPKFELV